MSLHSFAAKGVSRLIAVKIENLGRTALMTEAWILLLPAPSSQGSQRETVVGLGPLLCWATAKLERSIKDGRREE